MFRRASSTTTFSLFITAFAFSVLAMSSNASAGDRIVNGNQVAAVSNQVMERLDKADMKRGERLFKGRCRGCHTFEEGDKDKTGPNLWNVVGRKLGEKDGFKYSNDMKTMNAANTHWGYEELDKFLTKPMKFVPSTKMTFGGLRKGRDRADVIAFLRSQSTEPQPLPSSW